MQTDLLNFIIRKKQFTESDIDYVKSIITKENINETTYMLQNSLMVLAKTKDLRIPKILIDKGINVNQQDVYGRNVLMLAIQNKNIPFIEMILETNIRLNHRDDIKQNALYYLCAYFQNIYILNLLLEKNPSFVFEKQQTNSRFENILLVACENKKYNIDFIQILLDNGIEYKNLLYSISKKKYIEHDLIEFLIDYKFHEYLSDYYYFDTLKNLAENGKVKNLILLLKAKMYKPSIDFLKYLNLPPNFEIEEEDKEYLYSLIDKNDKNMPSFLIELCQRVNYDFIKGLVDRGIDITKGNSESNVLISYITSRERRNTGYDSRIVKLFLEKGISPHYSNRNKENLLHIICKQYQNEEIIKIIELLAPHIDINCRNIYNENALMVLCGSYPKVPTIKCLIKNGIDINAVNNIEENALLILCKYGNSVGCVETLVKNGINKRQTDIYNKNSIMYLKKGKKKYIEYLKLLL